MRGAVGYVERASLAGTSGKDRQERASVTRGDETGTSRL